MALIESMSNIEQMSDAELDVLERQIAAPYMRMFPLVVLIWGFTNAIVWLALWPLVFMDILPLWAAFPIATLNVALAYLPSHDAQHNIVARKGHPLRWLNELLGYVSLIPLAQHFEVMRQTHLEHHRHANDPQLDPDYDVHADSAWAFMKQAIGAPLGNRYLETLERIGRTDLIVQAVIVNVAYVLILFSLAWTGHALEAALLWWLPKHIALVWLRYYLSWMPHHPGHEQGRHRDTRAFKCAMGNIWSGGMQYHIVHHLFPTIPLTQTPAAYRALRPVLERKGCDLGEM